MDGLDTTTSSSLIPGEPVSEFEKPDVSGWAKASLIMGILGLTALPVIGGILAIVFARIAKKRILMSDVLKGDGLATAGQTLGIISLVLAGLFVFGLLMQERLRAFVADFFNWDTIKFWWPKVGRAFLTTLKLAVVSEFFILIVGLFIALMRISKLKVFRFMATVYIDVIRGLPLILLIFIIYFGLSYLGLNLSRFAAGAVALTVCYAAYEAEIFRAGIESIHKGQMEASRSLGMTYLQSMRYVVLPQAVRRVIPPLSNEFIMLTKDTALVAFIGLSEAFLVGKEGMGRDANVTPLVGVALFFLLVTIPAMRVVQYLEVRLAKGD
ncbi:MAG TPA: ABC transporter permease subunit [Candidatus Anoxymicrobiaceae bacterium]